MNQPVDGVDARTDRAVQGVVGVALLAAFVFRVPWLVPAFALLLAVGALGGPTANGLHLAFERWLAPRLPASKTPEPEGAVAVDTVRLQDALAALLLFVASLAFLLDIAFVAWILTIGEAVIAIIAATTRIHAAEHVRRWF